MCVRCEHAQNSGPAAAGPSAFAVDAELFSKEAAPPSHGPPATCGTDRPTGSVPADTAAVDSVAVPSCRRTEVARVVLSCVPLARAPWGIRSRADCCPHASVVESDHTSTCVFMGGVVHCCAVEFGGGGSPCVPDASRLAGAGSAELSPLDVGGEWDLETAVGGPPSAPANRASVPNASSSPTSACAFPRPACL